MSGYPGDGEALVLKRERLAVPYSAQVCSRVSRAEVVCVARDADRDGGTYLWLYEEEHIGEPFEVRLGPGWFPADFEAGLHQAEELLQGWPENCPFPELCEDEAEGAA